MAFKRPPLNIQTIGMDDIKLYYVTRADDVRGWELGNEHISIFLLDKPAEAELRKLKRKALALCIQFSPMSRRIQEQL